MVKTAEDYYELFKRENEHEWADGTREQLDLLKQKKLKLAAHHVANSTNVFLRIIDGHKALRLGGILYARNLANQRLQKFLASVK